MKNWLKLLVIIFSLVVFVTCTTTYDDNDTEDLPLPAAPINLVASAMDSSQIDLVWYVVSGVTGYKIYQSATLDGVYSEIDNISSNSYTNIGLSSNTEYYYKVKAYNVNGDSEFSNVASALTFVSTPTNLTASAVSSSQIDLLWNAVNGEVKYRIYKSVLEYGIYNKIGEVRDNFYSNTGLEANTAYFYKVKAYNIGGNSDFSNIAGDTTILATPTNLVAAALNLSQISLSWDAVDGAEGYYLYRHSTTSEIYTQIDVGSEISYTDIISNSYIKYFYRLKAYRATKVSDFSNTVDVRLSLLKPEGLSLVVQDQTHIRLSWDIASGVTGYFLYKSADNGKSYTAKNIGSVLSYNDLVSYPDIEYFYKLEAYNAADTSEFSEVVKGRINVITPENVTAIAKSSSQIDISWDAVSGAAEYRLHASKDSVTFSDIVIVKDTVYHDTLLSANTKYFYKVQSSNNAHTSGNSSIISKTTIVAAPTGLSDTVVSSSQINISWDTVAGAEGYSLYLSADDGETYSITPVVDSTTTYHFTGLTANKAYHYKVQAYNNNGYSEFSDRFIVTTKVLAPTSVLAKTKSSTQINISWGKVAGATGYIIYTSDSSSGVYSGVDLGKVTSYQSTGLAANTGYYYKVTAYSAAGESGFSDIVSDTTIVAVPANFSYKVVDSSKIDLSWSKVAGATEYYLSFSADSGQTYSYTPVGTDTLYHSTGLEANTKYFYAVRAYNLRGYSKFSDTLSTYTMVLTPRNVTAKSKSSSRIDISWSEVDGADGYSLSFSDDDINYLDTILGNVTAYQSTGLTANTEYFYRVRAYSAVGDSKASSTVSDTTIVAPPSNLSDSVVSASRIDLRWDTVPGAASYTIYRTPASGGVNDSVGGISSNFYSDTGLTANTVYSYKVKASNGNGDSKYSSIVSDTTIVAAPSNLTNSVSSASQIDLYWDAVTGADGYSLSFSVDSGRTYSDTAVGNVTTYSDTGLAANSVHYYKVRAYNTKGYSKFSAILSDTTIVVAPSSVFATTRSSERIDLSWGKVAGATGYKIYQLNSDGGYTEVDLVTDTICHSTGLSPNTTYSYKVTAYSGAGESDTSSVVSDITIVAAPSNFIDSVVSSSQIKLFWGKVDGADGYRLAISADGVTYDDTVDCVVTTYSHAGLTANSVHYYKVLAYNGKGDGAFSSTLCDTTIVLAPSNLTDSVVSASRIDLRWNIVAGAASYAIYRAPAIGGEYKVIGDTNSLIYHSTGLSANTAYFYKVLAYNGNGESEFSDTLSDTTKVAAPSNLTDSVISSSQIDLSWSSVAGATGYRLAFSADSGQSYSEIAVGNVTTYQSTGLAPNATYHYKVLAYNGKGDSEFSYTLIVTTIVATPASVTATAESSSQIDLAWSEVAGAKGYKIYLLNSAGDSTEIGDVTGELAYESKELVADTEYSYQVTAYSDAGESEASSTVSKTTLVAVPLNFTDSVVDSSQINLSWDSVKGATGYRVWFSADDGNTFNITTLGTSTTWQSTELHANKEYSYKVLAYNVNGDGEYSDTLRATTIVSAPAGLSATSKSSSQIDLVWGPVAGIDGYKIYRSLSASGIYDSVGVASSESYSDSTGLIANTEYYYKIRAYNGVGESDYSNIASDTTVVSPPENLTDSVVSSSQINLSWGEVDGATDYKVYRRAASSTKYKIASDISSNFYADILGLTADTEYSYKVIAYNGNGESEASSVLTTRTRVLAPAGLTATTQSASRIDLAWDEVSGASSYAIYRAPAIGGAYDSIGVDSSEFYADSTGLSSYTSYYYKVKAYSDAGKSAYSNMAMDTTMVAAPSNIIDSVISATQIKLSWDLVPGAINYTIHRASTIGGDYSQIGRVTEESYSDYSELIAATDYFYKVKAHNAKGDSEDSEIIKVTTRVLAPTDLVATAKSPSQIDLAWSKVKGADDYIIYRSLSSDKDYSSVGVTSSEQYNDSTGLTANIEYFYKVTASSASGESVLSDVASDTTIFLAPTNLVVTAQSSSQIGLSWSSVAGATSYNIYRATASNGDYQPAGTASSDSYEDNTELSAHTEYFYRVTAYNAGGESDSSETQSATTIVAAPANLTYEVVSAKQINLKWDSVVGATSYKISREPSSDVSVIKISTNYYESTGLSANTEYSYKVTATNANGDGAASEIKVTTRVLAPANLSATSKSSSKIALAWDEVMGKDGYIIYRAPSSNGVYDSVGVATTKSYEDSTGLAPNTVYYYMVKAYSGAGKSEYSNMASDTTIVAAPTNFADSVASAKQIDLSWSTVQGATTYKVYQSSSSGDIETKGIKDTFHNIQGLTPNTEYVYKVTAINTNGESEASSVLTATTRLNAPTSLLVTPKSSSQLDLTWDPVTDVMSYKIYRALTSTGTYAYIDSATSESYEDSTGLSANTKYFYKVTANNDAGESAFSSRASDTTRVLAPTNLADSIVSSSQINLSWSKVAGATSYTIYRALASNGVYQPIGDTTTAYYYSTGLAANTAYLYKVTANNGNGESEYSQAKEVTIIVQAPTNVSAIAKSSSRIDLAWNEVEQAKSYIIYRATTTDGAYDSVGVSSSDFYYDSTDLTSSTEYFYKVKSYSNAGKSEFSLIVSDFTIVATPTHLTDSIVSAKQINIYWNKVAGATSYRCYFSIDGGQTYRDATVGNDTFYFHSGLIANKEYYYKVKAYDANSESGFSDSLGATTKVLAPANLVATSQSSTQIDLAWDAVTDADDYKIYRAPTRDGEYIDVGVASSESYEDTTGLAANKEYFYKVTAKNASGESDYSIFASDTTIVAAPTNLADSVVSESRIDLSWDTVVGATSYYLSYSVDGSSYTDTAVGDVTTYSHTGLSANTEHYYKVQAHNGNGKSEFSSTLLDTTIVAAPANLTDSVISASQIDLSWSLVAGAAGYDIYIDTSRDGNYTRKEATTDTSFSIESLIANTVYFYKVLAHNGNGESEFSDTLSDTTIVAAPVNLIDTITSSSQIDIYWDTVVGATDYYLAYSADSGKTYTDTAVGNVTSYSHTGLIADTEYYYKVLAHNTKGNSEFSDELRATTRVLAPTGFSATTKSAFQIDLSWSEVEGKTGYKIYRSASSDGTYSEIDDITDTTYQSKELSANTTYYYKVTAYSDAGESEYSSKASETTMVAAPTNLTKTSATSSQITISWNKVEGATGYYFYFADGNLSFAGTSVGNVTSCTKKELTSNTIYHCKVIAYNEKGDSEVSNTLIVTTKVDAPTNLSAKTTTFGQINLSWSSVQGVTQYYIYRADSEYSSYSPIGNVAGTSYNDTWLSENQEYYYKVKAYTAAAGESADSNIANATTYITEATLRSKVAAGDDVTLVNTGGITDMSGLFYDKTKFNQDISKWDVSKVTDMSEMFYAADAFNQDIGGWQMNSVTNMEKMFFFAKAFNQDIGGWDVNNVTNMNSMFQSAFAFNQDIGGWNVSKVTNMSFMFCNASAFNQDIGDWVVGNVTTMRYMFSGASAFNQYIGGWKVSNVTDMSYMFSEASVFNQYIGGWDTEKLTNTSYMFYRAYAFNKSIYSWRMLMVTDMSHMFYEASAFNQDIGGWAVNSASNMSYMFYGADAFNQDIGDWAVSSASNMSYMFYGADAFNQDIGGWNVSSVTNMRYMFCAAKDFNQDISDWTVNKVTDMEGMFYSAVAFYRDIGGWDVSSVTDMDYMFYGVSCFIFDLSGWDVEKVTSHEDYDVGAYNWSFQKRPPFSD